MAGRDTLSSHREKPASHRKERANRRKESASGRGERPRSFGWLKRLSDRTPLRTKLITVLLGLVIVTLATISFTSVYVLRSYLTTVHDPQLRGVYQSITAAPAGFFSGANTNTVYPLKNDTNVFAGLQQPGDKLIPFQVPGGMGNGNLGSPRQQSVPDIPNTTSWADANSGKPVTLGAQSGSDEWRVIASPVTVDGVSGTLFVGYDLNNVNAEIQRLTTTDLTVSAAIIFVLTVVAVGVVKTNLRPLNDIEMIAGEIAKGHLDHRIPERDPRTEIGSLGQSLNIMLTQIETAFRSQEESERAAHASEERMRRFTADAAHELRTPLTTIRGFAAHYRQRGGAFGRRDGATVGARGDIHDAGGAGDQSRSSRTDAWFYSPANGPSGGRADPEGLSPEELDRLMSRIESEGNRMGLLVEDLLTLARLDQQRPLSMAPVDLLTLAADAVQDARIVSPGRPIDLVVAPGTAFIVDGDEPRLRQVLANLVNNAITHTPAGTPVRVKIAGGSLEAPMTDGPGAPSGTAGLAGQGDWGGAVGAAGTAYGSRAGGRLVPAVVLDIEDDGPGMSAEQAQRVFERFYRADAARNRASGGTGLGLAIVAGLVSAHGGTVSVRTAPGQGADFQVKLPLSPDALAGDDSDYDYELPA